MANVLVRKSAFTVDLPPRNRLYSLRPEGVGTPLVECLTSYVHRLAWSYRVSPRVFVTQEIVPNIREELRVRIFGTDKGGFYRSDAMNINGTGEVAIDLSDTLERLTMRSDLQDLTLRSWGIEFPSLNLLRGNPAWCPLCYHEWRRNEEVIYQPLLWMFQLVTVCLRHAFFLEERCPYCQKPQSVISAKARQGYCTQCGVWLGMELRTITENNINDETLIWQEWVVSTIKELFVTGVTCKSIPWQRLSFGLAACLEAVGTLKKLTHISNVPGSTIYRWIQGTRNPSFERVLALCYSINISPIQLMMADPATIKEALQTRRADRKPRPRRSSYPRIDRERVLEFIQTVLDGLVPPIGISQVARRLNIAVATLTEQFPQESALVVCQYRAYLTARKEQRITQTCEAVRQAIHILHEQRIDPSYERVKAVLPDPNVMARPEARSTWHVVRSELGLED